MFGFNKKMLIGLLIACTKESFGELLACNSDGRIKCISLNNPPCQARTTLPYLANKPLYYQFTVSVNKYGRSCNTIDKSYARVCVLDKVKNVKVFNLTLGVNETRFLVQHKSRECKCGLNESVCNPKQK